jgi:hypothetical protein
MEKLRTTSPNRKQIRKIVRQRKTQGNGASSIRAHRITLLIFSQRSHWWPTQNPMNQMQALTLSDNHKN